MYGALDNEDSVHSVYEDVLGRDPDRAGSGTGSTSSTQASLGAGS